MKILISGSSTEMAAGIIPSLEQDTMLKGLEIIVHSAMDELTVCNEIFA